MSTTALYYPNVTIVKPSFPGQRHAHDTTDLNLLITAALLWDDLEVIVPDGNFPVQPIIGHNQQAHSKAINEAFEMLIKPRVPTDAEKKTLLNELKKLLENGIPRELQYEVKADNYDMYPSKLNPEIWSYLEGAGLVKDWGDYYGIKRDFGLVIMGMIADICAGGTRRKVTNYTDAHSAYTRLLAAQSGTPIDFEPNFQDSYTTLATISIKSVNAGAFPLERVLKARKREQEDGILPPLRKKYREELDKYVERIKSDAKSPADVMQIEKDFERNIVGDFNSLAELLQLQMLIPLIPVGCSVLAAFFGQPWAVGAAAGAVAVALPTYRLRKNETLQKSFSGWLYAS
jgi:hypothetical protein